MSRFMKQAFPTDNAYIEFRFEHSLRKYEQKPVKKIKCNEVCGYFADHHKLKNHSVTPQRYQLTQSRGDKQHHGSIERQSVLQKQSESHLVSSNKTIRLSKRKPLDDKSENHQNNLELKMYASLVNISKGESKLQKSQEGKSQFEEQVFLNDFQISQGMEEEKQSQNDGDFHKIQITDKEKMLTEDNGVIADGVNSCELEQSLKDNDAFGAIEQNNKQQNSQIEDEQIIEQRISNHQKVEEDSLSAKIQQLSVVEAEQSSSHHNPQPKAQQHLDQIEFKEQSRQLPFQNSEVSCQSGIEQDKDSRPIRSRPVEESQILSSKLIQEHHMSESMMDKCLAFQGGRIYIDSQGQNFYISVRVFNKLRRQCSTVDDLIKVLIHQRPYLQAKKDQIQTELEQFLQYDA